MTEWNGTWHPIADKAPMRTEEELRKMADGIREGGQQYPCLMTPDGVGLDGRNRVAACRIAGVEPRWEVTEADPLTVIRECSDQRQWTTGQHAMFVALTLAGQGKRQDNGRWERGSIPDASDIQGALNMGQWRNLLSQAGAILDWLPHLADEVISGPLTLGEAYEKARDEKARREGEAEAEKERRRRIAALPADLAALVENRVRDLDDANAEAEARKVVAEIDAVRTGDGAPAPSFAERVQSGALSWAEARKLAEEWQTDRAESIQRDHDRLVKVTDGWAALRAIHEDPTNPYALDLLDSLQDHRRDAVQNIIRELNGGAE